MRLNRTFWPVILIGVGVLVLLANLGLVEYQNLYQLAGLWPVLIILAGIYLMFNRDHEWIGLALGLTVVALVILFLVFAPQVNLPSFIKTAEVQTEYFTAQKGGESSYTVSLDTIAGELTVNDQVQPNSLVDIESHTRYTSRLDVNHGDNTNVSFNVQDPDTWINPLSWIPTEPQYINVGLDPTLPLNFKLDHSSGSTDLDLHNFELTNLYLDLSSGTVDAVLPPGSYPVEIDISSGNLYVDFTGEVHLDFDAHISSGTVELDLVELATGTLDLDISSGNILLALPAGLGVQVMGEISSGSVNLPSSFTRVSGEDKVAGDEGTWQNEAYDPDGDNLIILFDISSGSLQLTQ